MSATNKASLLTKTHKILKKHYQPVSPPSGRAVLEHLLYAGCLENASYESADEAFAKLQEGFFDWNEVRVTTIGELAESLSCLPDPHSAAARVKKSLHSVFETVYSFDLEPMLKQNLGKATKDLEAHKGVTPFVVSYVTQSALGGHAIALDEGALSILVVLGIAQPKEAERGHIPGLERTIPKSKGIEFFSLLHQLGADYYASPFSPRVRSLLLEIAPDAKERLPKRSSRKAEEAPPKSTAAKKNAKKSAKAAAPVKTKKTASKKKAAAKPQKKAAAKKSTVQRKKSTTKSLAKKKPR